MSLSRIDVIQMFDLDLSRRDHLPNPRELLNGKSKSAAYDRCCESFSWIFEPQSVAGDAQDRLKDPTLRYLSQKVNCPSAPPKFDRFALSPNRNEASDRGGIITLSQDLQAGVLCTWKTYPGTDDPVRIKLDRMSVDIPKHYLKEIAPLFDYIAEGQLMYPFMALRYSSANLPEVIQQDGTLLGHALSGGMDHETDETMRSYVSESLSNRRYEGLFLRPSDGLGVYVSGTEASPESDLELYERTIFRAVQVCEICLLEQRLLRTFKTKVDIDARKVRIFPRLFLVEKRREELLELENEMVKSLPFRTTEAISLVRRAQTIFQIPTALSDAKDSYNFLEKRYQNTKTTALALLAVLTYVLDKLKVWDQISLLWTHPR